MRRSSQIIDLTYNILIVDDDQGIVDSLVFVLNKNGYQVSGMTDPVEAIEKIYTEKFDMLILDYLMYPINGDKVVEWIRESNPELYILLLTGNDVLTPLQGKITKLGIQDYCEKSDRFDELLQHVASAIEFISEKRALKKIQDK